MTFTEAALEVLRTAGEPLHYKKITELAIERNLLSHVGKTPEVTMSSRLAMMVKKDRGQAPIIKVKPGVFAIRESALQGTSLSPEALAAISEVEGGVEGLGESKTLEVGAAVSASATGEESVSIAPKAPLPGSDVFPEEEGDDDPILAGLEQDSEGGERSGRRRRRRRRRKGDKPEGASEAPSPRETNGNNNQRERFRDRQRPDRSERPERSDRNERFERQERPERQDRQERRAAEERSEAADASLDWNRQPADGDLLGKDLADAVASVMARGDRTPHTFTRVAELLVRRGRLSGAPAALAPTIAAAVRADIARSELQRARPRFRLRQHAGGTARLSLSDWHLPKGLQRAEQELLSTAERYASEMRRALIQKLSELPTAGFAELLATWLNAEGVTALRAVRRPGSSGSELHFAGTRKTGSEEVRLAIVVQRGSRDIDREGVIDVRGALHHYGHAQAAWIVTLGRITSGAREEASAQAAACALFDGNALVAAMERLGVAVRRNVIMHHEIDYDLLESLGDSPEQRERREREQERERREHNERTRAAQQQRSRSGRAAPSARPRDRDELDEDEQSASEGRPLKLRDADWDDEAPHDLGEAAEEEGVSEAPAPRAFALHDADGEESAHLRDELESDADETEGDEDFSTREESDEADSDEDFAARESDAEDADDADESDEDSDEDDDLEARADESESDDVEDSDEDEVADSDDSGEDFHASEDEADSDQEADDDSDEHESDEDAESDEEERETAERGRRR